MRDYEVGALLNGAATRPFSHSKPGVSGLIRSANLVGRPWNHRIQCRTRPRVGPLARPFSDRRRTYRASPAGGSAMGATSVERNPGGEWRDRTQGYATDQAQNPRPASKIRCV